MTAPLHLKARWSTERMARATLHFLVSVGSTRDSANRSVWLVQDCRFINGRMNPAMAGEQEHIRHSWADRKSKN